MGGTDCPEAHWASVSLLPNNPKDGPAIFDTHLSTGGGGIETLLASNGATRVTTGSNGTWSIKARVPMVFPGSSVIIATCRSAAPNATPSTGFVYRPDRVSVSTPYTLAVAPGTMIPPGSTLTVQANGGPCPAPAVRPIVALYERAGRTQVVARTMGEMRSGTYWQASLAVPPGLQTGQYQLEADCEYSRGVVFGSYAPVQMTVK